MSDKRTRIKIVTACRGSEDGAHVLDFAPDGGPNGDGVYEVTANLVAAFCDEQKTAERVGLAGIADKVAAAVSETVAGAAEAVSGKTKGGKAKAKLAEEAAEAGEPPAES